MAFAISTDPREYVLRADRELPPDQQTTFKVKPLSSFDRTRIDDLMEVYEDGRTVEITDNEGNIRKITPLKNPNRKFYETVYCGLIGWSNFKYADGSECKFSDNQKQNLDRLNDAMIIELFGVIEDMTEPTKAELENFPSPPSGS